MPLPLSHAAGGVLTEHRTRLLPDNAEKLIVMKYNADLLWLSLYGWHCSANAGACNNNIDNFDIDTAKCLLVTTSGLT